MISLLVPCYNAARYLPEFFESVRAQTTPFAETVCYDDGSADETADVAEAFGARVIRNGTNRGPSFARNRLIEAASADWVHFHDADDLLHPEFVARMSAQAERWRVPVLCGMQAIDRVTRKSLGEVSYEALNDPATDPLRFFLENTGYAIVGVYPRSALEAVGGFCEDLRGNEDPDLHVRLALAGVRFRAEPSVLVTNLMHRGSSSSRNWRQCLLERRVCFETYERAVPDSERSVLGRQALKLAQALHTCGASEEAHQSVQLAERCGVRHVDSHRWSMRALSRVVGIDCALRVRNLVYRLRERRQ